MKKTSYLGPIRIPDEQLMDFKTAMKAYGITRPEFARKCIDALIRHYKAGLGIAEPLVLRVKDS
jgi:hypothetical protein